MKYYQWKCYSIVIQIIYVIIECYTVYASGNMALDTSDLMSWTFLEQNAIFKTKAFIPCAKNSWNITQWTLYNVGYYL